MSGDTVCRRSNEETSFQLCDEKRYVVYGTYPVSPLAMKAAESREKSSTTSNQASHEHGEESSTKMGVIVRDRIRLMLGYLSAMVIAAVTDFRTVSSRRELGCSEVIFLSRDQHRAVSIPFAQWIMVRVFASCGLEEATDGDIGRRGRIKEIHRTWQWRNEVEDSAPGHSYPIASIEKRRESEQLPSMRLRRPNEQDGCNMHKPMCSETSTFVICLPEWSAIIDLN